MANRRSIDKVLKQNSKTKMQTMTIVQKHKDEMYKNWATSKTGITKCGQIKMKYTKITRKNNLKHYLDDNVDTKCT